MGRIMLIALMFVIAVGVLWGRKAAAIVAIFVAVMWFLIHA